MDWKAEYDQQKIALRRVFLMFTWLALTLTAVAIRQRGWTYCLPLEDEFSSDPNARPKRKPSKPPTHLHAPTQMLLCAARLALALLDAITRTAHELMNRAHTLSHWFALSVWVYPPADQCGQPWARLDSS